MHRSRAGEFSVALYYGLQLRVALSHPLLLHLASEEGLVPELSSLPQGLCRFWLRRAAVLLWARGWHLRGAKNDEAHLSVTRTTKVCLFTVSPPHILLQPLPLPWTSLSLRSQNPTVFRMTAGMCVCKMKTMRSCSLPFSRA